MQPNIWQVFFPPSCPEQGKQEKSKIFLILFWTIRVTIRIIIDKKKG
ncbi:hypothetical protein HMPREF3182_00492 [Megasphaera hutchinsoni]|uniref:Uncharacterized protein n=1 Tax=Megasphaera hutchinsoni TaxID=1588748 RepID=A0A134CJJ9_9FIRM|nr:hypothetical protein HMPREF3182_00492 [Megasphaera hutchinsoni]